MPCILFDLMAISPFSQVSLMLLHPHILNLAANYQDDNHAIAIRTSVSPATLHLLPPTLNVSITRKLFRQRFEQGTLSMNIGRQPQVSFNFISPTRFELGAISSLSPPIDHIGPGESPSPPSVSGLRFGTAHRSCGFVLDSRDPKLVGEWGILFTELALQVKVGLELGVSGLAWLFSGSWSNQTSEISATTYLNPLGVVLKLESAILPGLIYAVLTFSQVRVPGATTFSTHCPFTRVQCLDGVLDSGLPIINLRYRVSLHSQTPPPSRTPCVSPAFPLSLTPSLLHRVEALGFMC